jgi:TonB family protein
MDSVTDGESSFAVPVGNTTMIDPSKSGKHGGPLVPLPASVPGPPEPPYHPVSALQVKTMPEINEDECGLAIKYPEEARKLGIQGVVFLRVELDEKGHVHAIKVTTGLGHGLDEVAVHALKTSPKCKFSPAVSTDGTPVSYVIPRYGFRFVLPE